MKDFIRKNKFTTIIAATVLVFFLWAQSSSFKLFKSEYGTKYAPNATHGSVHHK
jgi:hypothetical protein